jgi:hypothetical protein
MNIELHKLGDMTIAEVVSENLVLGSADQGLDLLGTLYFSGFDRVILHEKDITPDFFELKNGMAGEVLQKFSNYRVKLAIIGSFEDYKGRSINDFIIESNKFGHISFVKSREEALEKLKG